MKPSPTQSCCDPLWPVTLVFPDDVAATWLASPLRGALCPQVGAVLALSLHCCSSRRPLHRPRLRTPVTAEFGEEDGLVRTALPGPSAACRLPW